MSSAESTASPVVTPLRQRLRAVFVLYRTRPLTWVALVVYLIAIAGVLHNLYDPRPPFEQMIDGTSRENQFSIQAERMSWESQRRMTVTPRERTPLPRLHFASPEVRQSFNQGKTISPEDVRTIVVIDQQYIPDDFWEPGRYPRVEAVINYGEPFKPEVLRKLLQTYPLKTLILHRSDLMNADDLRLLGQSESLEELSLDHVKDLTTSEAIAWPKNLRSLTMKAYHPLPLVRFQEWRMLAHLDVLNFGVHPDVQPRFLTPEIIAELEQFPQQPTLFLDTPQGDGGDWAVALQPQFHRLAVRPRTVLKIRMTVAMYAYFLLLIPTACGLYQLSMQSLQPLMLLAPGAAAPHQFFAAGWWLLGAVFSATLVSAYGVHWTAVLAVGVSGVLSYLVLYGLTQRSRGMEQVGFAHPMIAALPIMLLGLIFGVGTAIVHFYPTVGGEIDWFLRGQRPITALVIFSGGLIGAAVLLRRMVLLQRSAHEAGLGQVPMSVLDLGGWNRAVAPLAGRKFDSTLRWNPVMRTRERRIEAALHQGPALTRWQRVRIWMCGVHAHPVDMATVVAFVALLQFGIFQFARQADGSNRPERAMLLIPAIQVLMMFLMLPLASLWIRRRWMPQELLFPLSRREWRRDWYAVQAYMLLPIPVVLVLIAITDWLMGSVLRPTSREMAWGTSGLACVMIATWALSLITVTLRNAWITIAVTFLAISVVISAVFVMANLWPDFPTSPAAPVVVVSVVAAGLVALVLWARHRWDHWEVGRLS